MSEFEQCELVNAGIIIGVLTIFIVAFVVINLNLKKKGHSRANILYHLTAFVIAYSLLILVVDVGLTTFANRIDLSMPFFICLAICGFMDVLFLMATIAVFVMQRGKDIKDKSVFKKQ